MADISKCDGLECPLKESCYRYNASESEIQSYIEAKDCIENENDMYWHDEFVI